ncbi:hypothetical protein Q7P36_007504 [Cladosporium allicinum]
MANNETPNNDAPIYPIKNASSSANQQLQSKIMHLPQEVRDEIYANVFYSTHFTYAHEGHPIESSARETGLALLRTCRRVRDEIGVSWLHQVLFNFLDPFTLLNKLADLPITLREQICHVCVSGRELMIVYDEESESSYNTAQILKLLPGLKLDTLTVVGTRALGPFESFYNLDLMIRHSDGWKELHYLSDNSEPLAYKVDGNDAAPWETNPEYSPCPQPSDWQNTVEQRDGQASHPSVAIYQATPIAAPGAAMPDLYPSIQESFALACTTDHLRKVFTRDARFFVKLEEARSMTLEALEKHMLTIVKRGVGVDYAEKEGSTYLPFGDIREYSPGMTWREINPPPSPVSKYDDDWY